MKREIPLDDREAEIRRIAAMVAAEFEHAARNPEYVLGIACLFAYSQPVPWMNDPHTNMRVFDCGMKDEIAAAAERYIEVIDDAR